MIGSAAALKQNEQHSPGSYTTPVSNSCALSICSDRSIGRPIAQTEGRSVRPGFAMFVSSGQSVEGCAAHVQLPAGRTRHEAADVLAVRRPPWLQAVCCRCCALKGTVLGTAEQRLASGPFETHAGYLRPLTRRSDPAQCCGRIDAS